jgi:hypothetical protein
MRTVARLDGKSSSDEVCGQVLDEPGELTASAQEPGLAWKPRTSAEADPIHGRGRLPRRRANGGNERTEVLGCVAKIENMTLEMILQDLVRPGCEEKAVEEICLVPDRLCKPRE